MNRVVFRAVLLAAMEAGCVTKDGSECDEQFITGIRTSADKRMARLRDPQCGDACFARMAEHGNLAVLAALEGSHTVDAQSAKCGQLPF
jgi:hypothetical protein